MMKETFSQILIEGALRSSSTKFEIQILNVLLVSA